MLKEKLQKKVDGKLEAMSESVKCTIDALCEISGDLQTIQYLLWLKNGGIQLNDEETE